MVVAPASVWSSHRNNNEDYSDTSLAPNTLYLLLLLQHPVPPAPAPHVEPCHPVSLHGQHTGRGSSGADTARWCRLPRVRDTWHGVMRPPWCDEWHPVMWTPAVTHHMTRVRGSSSVSSCCSSSVVCVETRAAAGQLWPSPALTSPLYQAATFDLCRCGDEMTAREHYLGWPHLTVTSEQTRELPPPSSYTTMVTLVTLNFIPDLFKEFDFEQEKELHSMESIIIPFMW